MANDNKSGTKMASSVIVAALLATGAYFFHREALLEMIANIEKVGFFRREAPLDNEMIANIKVGFVNGGVWLILALFVPALCLLSVSMRSRKTVELDKSILKTFHLDKSVYYQQCPEIAYAGIWCKAWFPILIISLLCIYYATILVFTGTVVGTMGTMGDFLFQHDQSLEVMCFAYLGWYVWTVSTFFTRIVTLELVAATFWNILIRLVIAGFVALIIHVSGLFEQKIVLAGAIGFGVGLFPDSALQWLTDKLRFYLLGTGAGTEELPLDLIQGVSSFRKLRLFELGLDDCQNLASVNAIELYFASNLKLAEVMDWIAQAQLATLLGKKNFKILQGKGYRNAVDFDRVASSDPKVLAPLLKFTEEHLKDLAAGMKKSPSYKRLTNLWTMVLNEGGSSVQAPEPFDGAAKDHLSLVTSVAR